MPTRTKLALAALVVLCAAFPAGTSLASDICRRPCQFYIPQKGEADPTAFGCRDLIDNLSGTCGISFWDLSSGDDVEISHPLLPIGMNTPISMTISYASGTPVSSKGRASSVEGSIR